MCSDDTTASRPGGHRASSSPSPFRGGGNLNIFSLWENTLNLTTCSGCNIPVKLAKTKNTKSGVLSNTDNQTTKKAKEILSVFTCGCAVFFSKCFTMKNLIARRGLVSRRVVNLSSDGALCFQH